jgi:hypothetical protein
VPISDLDLNPGVYKGVTGSGNVATTGNPATGGTGINLFEDPEAVYNSFRRVLLDQDRTSSRGSIYGLPRWNLDLSVGKRIRIASNVNAVFTAEAVNVFNRLQFGNPTLNLASPQSFGVISNQAGSPRQIQLGFRVEF